MLLGSSVGLQKFGAHVVLLTSLSSHKCLACSYVFLDAAKYNSSTRWINEMEPKVVTYSVYFPGWCTVISGAVWSVQYIRHPSYISTVYTQLQESQDNQLVSTFWTLLQVWRGVKVFLKTC